MGVAGCGKTSIGSLLAKKINAFFIEADNFHGKANIKKNLQELGLTLSDENIKKVTNRIIELGDKKEKVTAEDLPYIISDVLNTSMQVERVLINSYQLKHLSLIHI